jgi:hypothetical protein
VWSAFLLLHERRGYSADGPQAITWSDLRAWPAVTGARLSALDLDWLLDLDRRYMALIAEAAK